MSQEAEFDANNLCTVSEDAFERFQAVSMYEEEEYITLADIVPPKPRPPDLDELICDQPYENEVIISTENNGNAATNSNSGENVTYTYLENADSLNPESSQPHYSTEIELGVNGEEIDVHMEIDNTDNLGQIHHSMDSSTDNLENNVTVSDNDDTMVSRTRRRKQKDSAQPVTYTTPLNSDYEYYDISTNGRKRRGRPRKTAVCDIPVETKSKGRRGRPKKSLEEENNVNISSSDTQINNVTSTESEELTSETVSPTTKSKRQRKPANTEMDSHVNSETNPQENTRNDDLEDISLSKLRDIPTSLTNEKNDADMVIDHVENNKTTKGKKKGRKSKKTSDVAIPGLLPELPLEMDNVFDNIEVDPIEDDDADDICLSKLKTDIKPTESIETSETVLAFEPTIDSQDTNLNDVNDTPKKRSSKVPVMSDFEYNVDKVIGKYDISEENSLLVEDTSKRPNRRKIQKLKYDEDSDEDPFANMVLPDDEPRKRKGRYNSDDEYIPGKREATKSVESSDSEELDDLIGEVKKPRRKNSRKSETASPLKKRKPDLEPAKNVDETSLSAKSTGDSAPAPATGDWGGTSEFENFLAKKMKDSSLKIKKVSSTKSTETKLAPLEIPTIDPEAKKTIETGSQTNIVATTSSGVQTEPRYYVPMKTNVNLTTEQSEKACTFLSSIVKTTAELGQLMTMKSEDFITKKINTAHVTDTFKMDYCVKKSFLLFKLAKSNLLQMEEDLAKQYDLFLKDNNLSKCREEVKEIAAKTKEANNDSDCEIVDEQPPTKTKQPAGKPKAQFNPKTVFLNKELSIKIAKKPVTDSIVTKTKKLDIKGRHTVWLNDTVMVKKVAPTQSFLAQDSRNKKPPDSRITTKMVSDFFKDYYCQKEMAKNICAPFVTRDWLRVNNECVCNYFVYETNPTDSGSTNHASENNNIEIIKTTSNLPLTTNPETLFNICFQLVKNQIHGLNGSNNDSHKPKDFQEDNNNPMTLLQLSLRALNISKNNADTEMNSSSPSKKECLPLTCMSVLPLKNLCHRRIVEILFDSRQKNSEEEPLSESYETLLDNEHCSNEFFEHITTTLPDITYYEVKPLLTLCVEFFQREQSIIRYLPNTLKHIAFLKIKELLYENSQIRNKCPNKGISIGGLTINSVNTLSEEAFLNLEPHADMPDESEYMDEFDHDELYNSDYENCEDQNESSWVSQIQIDVNQGDEQHEHVEATSMPIITQIKLEPIEDLNDNTDAVVTVKSEPIARLDEMTVIPDLKSEFLESFGHDYEDIYSQSGQRIRRQHEPDYVEDYVPNLGLLVPQTYEPLVIETAKGSLMESSSDESNKNKKAPAKKKVDKRKTKQKKPDPKPAKEPLTTKTKGSNNEVATLTRKMREKIRQEKDSSDSESENLPRLRSKKEAGKSKTIQNKAAENEIQCNNVDSTDKNEEENLLNFTGFSAIDQNEISSYQKYMKFVYDKILPKNGDKATSNDVPKDNNTADPPKDIKKLDSQKIQENVSNDTNPPIDTKVDKDNRSISPVINPDEPVELLECEPTMPVFYDKDDVPITKKKEVTPKKKEVVTKKIPKEVAYEDRHGWHCYPVDTNDKKIYERVCIGLEKLPESFVQTYFEYQEINCKDKTDLEINRLTNLNSLNRGKELKERKSIKVKRDVKTGDSKDAPLDDNIDDSGGEGFDDRCAELTPSEDEGTKAEDEVPPPVALRHPENNIAKKLLMNNDSDSDSGAVKVKQELLDPSDISKGKGKVKVKKGEVTANPEDLMLTADKMMNKELKLLHAPVVLGESAVVKDAPSKQKSKTTSRNREHTKAHNEDDSSSEEEKQWVNTKEKLLKRMGKKDCTSIDDAKRAKLVSEFIERRGGNIELRKCRRGKNRRSAKKFLEREKQLRVLSRELFGENSSDPTIGKRSAAYFKGRRNIRKVIDKKSLARSTVKANMEEFERKRRLNSRQTRLRELLGCEEGVNVLVINDEVCLEYDFEEHRPVVTVHPFFTKVMKAHQYEGVKFMWDACFESLDNIAAGEPGGGCILAHCMGLGKTLQVLALLHTVLTHPRVGMQRVLVCCPLSTVLNWVDEIHKWIGPVTNQIKVFELSKLRKTYERAYQLEDWYNGGGIFIIGYELFRSLSTLDADLDDVRPTIINKIRTALLDPGPDIVVCDEGHLLKNDCSVLAVAMSRVATKRRIILTGTPMQNNLREYYCMVNFVKPNLLGTYAEYSNRFENPIMNGQHRDSREEDIKLMKARTHILHKVLEGCLQRQEASVLYPYLPKKHEYTLFIALTKCQWDLYKHYLNHYANRSKQSVLKDFHMLQKIWSHPQVLHNFQTKARKEKDRIKAEKLEDDLATEDLEDIKPSTTELWWLDYCDNGNNMLETLDSSNKFVAVFRILEECVALGDKVLIFSTSLYCLDALEFFLKSINKWSLGQEYYRLDGSVPAEVRQKWCREFNAEHNVNTKLFLVSTRAGCLGLNMTAANRVIILDTSWNPAHDIQSIFRVYRFGQKKDCYIYRLVAMGTMEQKIYERSVTKQAVACRVVDEQQIDRHYNMAELTELYKFDEAGSSVAGGVAAGVRDVALLRVARAAALHAVHEHDSLLRGSSEQGLPEHERAAAWMQFQQEQHHKQVENKLIANIPKLSLKRVGNGNDYTSSTSIAPNVTVKTESKESSAPKRGRPRKILNNSIPNENQILPDLNVVEMEPVFADAKGKRIKVIMPVSAQPGTSQSSHSRSTSSQHDEIIVEQISEILLQHKFDPRTRAQDVPSLVANVTNIVKRGYMDDNTDELTASIARVMLMKRMSVPVVNNIMCESINTSELSSNKTRVYDLYPRPIPGFDKGKRKAAVLAADQMTSMSQNVVINLDDDDADFVPTTYQKKVLNESKKDDAQKRIQTPNRSKALEIDTPIEDDEPDRYSDPDSGPENNVIPAAPATAVTQVTAGRKRGRPRKYPATPRSEGQQGQSSILLSDDEPPTETDKTKTQKQPAPEPTDDEDERVALPIHLLSNKNFINIVAHTYLEGNPMLDEDAATLAAQYSTLKALKECEQTGAPIYSGPIHDIAVKVIGKSILKKMNTKIDSLPAKDSGSAAEKMRDEMLSKAMSKHSSVKGEVVEEQLPTVTGMVKAGPGQVVPVGLINASLPSTESSEPYEECILPDDDVTVVTSAPTPVLVRPGPRRYKEKDMSPTPIAVTKVSPPQPIAITKTAPKPPVVVTKATHTQPIIIRKAMAIPPAVVSKTVATSPAVVTNAVLTVKPAELTICLDSDDEEPVPVALSHAVSSPAPPPPAPAPAPARPTPVTMVRNPNIISLGGGNFEPSISLYPSSTASTPLLNSNLLQTLNPKSGKSRYILVPMSQIVDQMPQTSGIVTTPGIRGLTPITPKFSSVTSPASQVYAHQPKPAPGRAQPTRAPAPGPLPPLQPAPSAQVPIPVDPPSPEPSSQAPAARAPSPVSNLRPRASRAPAGRAPAPAGRAPAPAGRAPAPASRAPAPANTTTVTTAKCKPGDVFRISKTGEIEVINIDDIVSKETAGRKEVETKKIEEPKRVLKSPARVSRVRGSSSSSSSRSSASPSPPPKEDDQLSIFKDVVHIFDSPTTSKESTNSDVVFQPAASPKRPPPTKPNKLPLPSKKPPSKPSMLKPSTSNAVNHKLKPLLNDSLKKSNENQITSIIKAASSKKDANVKILPASSLKIVSVPKSEAKGLVTGSKNKSDKPVSVFISNTSSSNKDKKRPSTSTDTSAPKKKKQGPMTLQDFNLDDIDDIIELD